MKPVAIKQSINTLEERSKLNLITKEKMISRIAP
jgi:hypothetical protein